MLPRPERDLFYRLYHVSRSVGHLVVPESSRPWITHTFGSVEAVENQTVVRLTNMTTLDGAIFNPLRAHRPFYTLSGDLEKIIEESRGDQFCAPELNTPEDVFGRVRGLHSVTGSNVAKYAPFHGLLISDEHDPLHLSEGAVRDYLEVGRRWAAEAMRVDPDAKYYFFGWNALWSAGASVIHGHAQVSCFRDMHYAGVERLRRAALAYRERSGTNYFTDLEKVHESLELSFVWQGVSVLAHLTPTRDKEVLLMVPSQTYDASETPGGSVLPSALYRVLDCLVSSLGTRSFNVALCMSPLGPVLEDWSGFPVLVRIVDRGDPMKRTSDVAFMELYGSQVVNTDPFWLVEALRERFSKP